MPALKKVAFIAAVYRGIERIREAIDLGVEKVVLSLVSLLSQPWVYRLGEFLYFNWFVLWRKIGEKAIQFVLSKRRSIPLFSLPLLDEPHSQHALPLPLRLHLLAASLDRLMPELEKFSAHNVASFDPSQSPASVSLEARTHIINVVELASLQPHVALNACEFLFWVLVKVIAVREQ